jgi:hypothetical protein
MRCKDIKNILYFSLKNIISDIKLLKINKIYYHVDTYQKIIKISTLNVKLFAHTE